MTLLIILVVALAALVLWVTAARVRFHLDDRPALVKVTTADGWTLSLWERKPDTVRFTQPVVLCHGLGNNHAIFEFQGQAHFAKVLADAGFHVFSMDCRGAGRSVPADPAFVEATVDDYVDLDVPAVLDVVRARTGQAQVLWVGHSLGGIVGVLASARKARGRFAALVTIGSPLFFHPTKFFIRALAVARRLAVAGRFPARVLCTMVAPVAGRFPAPNVASITAVLGNITGLEQRYLMANVIADLWRGVMTQLEDWLRTDRLTSAVSGEDLRTPALALTDIPTMVVGGSLDKLAPLPATQRLFDSLAAKDKELLLVGRAYGSAVEYGHGDLLVGRDAPNEVFPPIVRFLTRVARPVPSSPSAAGAHAALPLDASVG